MRVVASRRIAEELDRHVELATDERAGSRHLAPQSRVIDCRQINVRDRMVVDLPTCGDQLSDPPRP
jgi:hypothetical protein